MKKFLEESSAMLVFAAGIVFVVLIMRDIDRILDGVVHLLRAVFR